VSIRGDLRVGETLRGTLREKSRSYTVMGRILLQRRNQANARRIRCEQWRLLDDNGKELWLEINRDPNEVVLNEPVPIRPTIDPRTLEVGWTRQLRVRGRLCTVEVEEVHCAEIDHETGAINHPNGALTTTTCAELRVVDAEGSLSRMVIDAHRLQGREVYGKTPLSSSQQYEVFGRPVYRPWWIPSVVRRFWRWFLTAISGASGSWLTHLFWFVLLFVVMVLLELIDDDGFIPSGGGSFFRNRSVYGGGGGGVGK